MKLFMVPLRIAALTVAPRPTTDSKMERGLVASPKQTKPWCYWYLISDNLSKHGITRHLEVMARMSIGGALIDRIFLDKVVPGKVKVLSEEWWQIVKPATREGGYLGVNIGRFDYPSWSQSAGPS